MNEILENIREYENDLFNEYFNKEITLDSLTYELDKSLENKIRLLEEFGDGLCT